MIIIFFFPGQQQPHERLFPAGMQEPSSLKRTGYLRLQEKKLSRAIATAPDDVEGWMQYGYVLLEQDQHKEVSLCFLSCFVSSLV